ncbi:MAG: sugar phosphate isomerase/epimerase [Dictyoglomaceae bacterium]|nr:sugar phosphate isomerase/epimerase [Dictyoglomaceae bacterium]
MEIVWSSYTFFNLPLEEEVLISKEFCKFIELDDGKIKVFLKEKSINDLKRILEENSLKPILINHNVKLEVEFFDENKWKELIDITLALNIPFLLVNPGKKTEWLSFNLASSAFSQNLKKLLSILPPNLILTLRIDSFSLINTFGKAWKILKEIPNLTFLLDTFHFYISGEEMDVFREKDLSKIMFIHLKDAENIPRYYLKESNQVLPGDGVIPLTNLLLQLKENGFNNFIVPEIRRLEYEKLEPREFSKILFMKTKNILSFVF